MPSNWLSTVFNKWTFLIGVLLLLVILVSVALSEVQRAHNRLNDLDNEVDDAFQIFQLLELDNSFLLTNSATSATTGLSTEGKKKGRIFSESDPELNFYDSNFNSLTLEEWKSMTEGFGYVSVIAPSGEEIFVKVEKNDDSHDAGNDGSDAGNDGGDADNDGGDADDTEEPASEEPSVPEPIPGELLDIQNARVFKRDMNMLYLAADSGDADVTLVYRRNPKYDVKDHADFQDKVCAVRLRQDGHSAMIAEQYTLQANSTITDEHLKIALDLVEGDQLSIQRSTSVDNNDALSYEVKVGVQITSQVTADSVILKLQGVKETDNIEMTPSGFQKLFSSEMNAENATKVLTAPRVSLFDAKDENDDSLITQFEADCILDLNVSVANQEGKDFSSTELIEIDGGACPWRLSRPPKLGDTENRIALLEGLSSEFLATLSDPPNFQIKIYETNGNDKTSEFDAILHDGKVRFNSSTDFDEALLEARISILDNLSAPKYERRLAFQNGKLSPQKSFNFDERLPVLDQALPSRSTWVDDAINVGWQYSCYVAKLVDSDNQVYEESTDATYEKDGKYRYETEYKYADQESSTVVIPEENPMDTLVIPTIVDKIATDTPIVGENGILTGFGSYALQNYDQWASYSITGGENGTDDLLKYVDVNGVDENLEGKFEINLDQVGYDARVTVTTKYGAQFIKVYKTQLVLNVARNTHFANSKQDFYIGENVSAEPSDGVQDAVFTMSVTDKDGNQTVVENVTEQVLDVSKVDSKFKMRYQNANGQIGISDMMSVQYACDIVQMPGSYKVVALFPDYDSTNHKLQYRLKTGDVWGSWTDTNGENTFDDLTSEVEAYQARAYSVEVGKEFSLPGKVFLVSN